MGETDIEDQSALVLQRLVLEVDRERPQVKTTQGDRDDPLPVLSHRDPAAVAELPLQGPLQLLLRPHFQRFVVELGEAHTLYALGESTYTGEVITTPQR